MKTTRTLLIAAALVLVASWAIAGPGGMGGWGRGMGPGYGTPPTGAHNLTLEQSQQLQELRQSHFNEIAPLQNQVFSKRAEMRMLWTQPNPDAGKIAAKQREIQTIETQLREKATQHQLAVRKILTPEQMTQMPGMGYGMGYGIGHGRGDRMHGRW